VSCLGEKQLERPTLMSPSAPPTSRPRAVSSTHHRKHAHPYRSSTSSKSAIHGQPPWQSTRAEPHPRMGQIDFHGNQVSVVGFGAMGASPPLLPAAHPRPVAGCQLEACSCERQADHHLNVFLQASRSFMVRDSGRRREPLASRLTTPLPIGRRLRQGRGSRDDPGRDRCWRQLYRHGVRPTAGAASSAPARRLG
jgi:hypothetical protein